MPNKHRSEKTVRDQSVAQLKTVNTFIEQATVTIVGIAERMQKQVASLPDGETKATLETLVSELFETCTFEDIVSRETIGVIALLANDALEECVARHNKSKEGRLSQEEVDKLFE